VLLQYDFLKTAYRHCTLQVTQKTSIIAILVSHRCYFRWNLHKLRA